MTNNQTAAAEAADETYQKDSFGRYPSLRETKEIIQRLLDEKDSNHAAVIAEKDAEIESFERRDEAIMANLMAEPNEAVKVAANKIECIFLGQMLRPPKEITEAIIKRLLDERDAKIEELLTIINHNNEKIEIQRKIIENYNTNQYVKVEWLKQEIERLKQQLAEKAITKARGDTNDS